MTTTAAVVVVFAFFQWCDSHFGRRSWDLKPDINIVPNSEGVESDRLFIILAGAYAPAQKLFWGIATLPKRGDIMYVENPARGYDARIIADTIIENIQLKQYSKLTIVPLSMGIEATIELLKLLAREHYDARDVSVIAVATPMRRAHMKMPIHHIAAMLWWIGPMTDVVLTPLVRWVLFRPAPTKDRERDIGSAGIDQFVAEMRRFHASAVFAHAHSACKTKRIPPALAHWLKQGVRIVTVSSTNDPVVNFDDATDELVPFFADSDKVIVLRGGHVGIDHRPAIWDIGFASACEKGGMSLLKAV